ncbi:MAG: mechanosensitive ion channel [Candidatus Lokiarchaeota archaeon]|nr:mechanosensitive ion channel [Candidatus Lokiarchaeota archaeon]
MKKLYQILLIIVLVIAGYWIYFYSNIDQTLIYLILVNIVVYVLRMIILRISNQVLKGKIIRYILSITINIIWSVFIFTLLFYVSPNFSVAIISFLIVAISLTFKERINNIASGVLILTSEDFEITDLVETNGVQGIVEDITLNYTKVRDFNGITIFLPNVNVFNASTKKFTSMESFGEEDVDDEEKGSKEETLRLKKYVKKFGEFVSKEDKITRYIRILEILPEINPMELNKKLDNVFSKYKKIFGFKPFYYVNETILGRCSITVQVISEKPKNVVYFINAFLRDIAIELYKEQVQDKWDPQKAENQNLVKMVEAGL